MFWYNDKTIEMEVNHIIESNNLIQQTEIAPHI